MTDITDDLVTEMNELKYTIDNNNDMEDLQNVFINYDDIIKEEEYQELKDNYDISTNELYNRYNKHYKTSKELEKLKNQIDISVQQKSSEYILFIIWIIITIFILCVTIINILDNNDDVSTITITIIIIFMLYVVYYIFKNFFNFVDTFSLNDLFYLF